MTSGGPGSAGPLMDATNNYASPGSAPLSPAELPQPATPAPPAPPAPATPPVNPAASDTGAPPPATPPPAPAPTPMPVPRPAAAPGPVAPPPAATPPGPPVSLAPPPAPNPDSGPAAPPVQPASSYRLGDQTALGRAIGINPNATDPGSNNFRSAMAGLGQGLTAAGNSKGKSAGQALASGAGGAITGSTKQDSDQYNQRLKALQLAVQAQQVGDKAAYNKNYADYLKGKLANDSSSGSKKNGSWNKPDSQKFIDAQNAMSKDSDIKASEKLLEQLAKGKDPGDPDLEKAKAAHTALVQQKQNLYLSAVGLDPAKIKFNSQIPPGTPPSKNPDGSANPGNPHIVNSQAEFDTYVKPGQAYVIPSGPHKGEIYIRKAADQKAADQNADATDQGVSSGATTGTTTPVLPPGPEPAEPAAEPAAEPEAP